ncbi:MAG: hypothetical protein ACP5U1_03780 [Desulfomonilaceae bacterium]
MKKIIIALALVLAPFFVTTVMSAGGQNVPIHNPQTKRVEQWHKNQNDRFKIMLEELATSFRNLESECRDNRSPGPFRTR